jgi:hypothetical protein
MRQTIEENSDHVTFTFPGTSERPDGSQHGANRRDKRQHPIHLSSKVSTAMDRRTPRQNQQQDSSGF